MFKIPLRQLQFTATASRGTNPIVAHDPVSGERFSGNAHVGIQCWYAWIALLMLFGVVALMPLQAVEAQPLNLEVTVSDDSVQPGQWFYIRATVSNTSTAPLSGVVIQGQIPQESGNFRDEVLTGGGTCLGGVCSGGEIATWNLGTLGVGESRIVEMPLRIFSESLVTSVFEAGDGGVPNDAQTTVAITVEEDPTPAVLDVAIHAGPGPVAPGEALIYTLSYSNRGTGQASGVTLRVLLPAGVSVLSTDNGMINGNTVEWNLGTIGAGQGGQREVTVTVPASPNGEILVAEAQIRDGLDSQPESRASEAVAIHDDDALQLVVTVTDDPVEPQQHFFYRATASNTGTEPLSNVVLQTWVPQGAPNFSDNFLTEGGGCNNGVCSSGELVLWGIGSLGVGESRTVEVQMRISASPGSLRTLRFFADYPGNPALRVTSETVLIGDNPDPATLDVAIDAEPGPVAPGEALTYTLSYSNRGIGQASGVTLSARLPAGVSVLSSDGGSINGNTVEWDLGTVGAGQGGQREVTVTVPALPNGEILVAEARIHNGPDPQPESRASDAVVIHDDDSLQLVVTVTDDPLQSQQYFFYRATVSNTGAEPLSNVVLQTWVPRESPNFSDNFLTEGGGCDNGVCSSGERVVWNLGNLGVGESRTVEVQMRISAPPGSLRTLRFFADYPGNPALRVTSETLLIGDDSAPATLDVAIDAEPGPVAPGEALTYTLSFGNSGTGQTSSVTLSARLPDGASVLSTDGGTINGNTVEWNLGTVGAGQGGQREVTVTVPASPNGEILVAEAQIRDDQDPRSKSRASDAVVIHNDDALQLVVTVTDDPLQSRQDFFYRATVSNTGTVPLSNVVLRTWLPRTIPNFTDELMTEGAACDNGVCSSGERVFWGLGSLGVGESRTVEVPIRITASPGSLRTLRFFADYPGNPALRAAAETVLIGNEPGPVALDVAIDAEPGPVAPGEGLTYTISFGNRGTGQASGVTLTALLPTGVVTWALGNLAAGEVGQCQFSVTPQSLTDGQILTAEALIRDGIDDQPESRASIVTQVRGNSPVDLALSAASTVVLPENQTVVRARILNGSTIPLSNVGLQARIPLGISSFSESLLTEGGTCSSSCSSNQLAAWNFPLIGAGQQSPEVEMPISVSRLTSPGSLITTRFFARFSFGAFQQLIESKTVLVGNSFGACPPAQVIPAGLIFQNGFEG